jgi:hypothetical protein
MKKLQKTSKIAGVLLIAGLLTLVQSAFNTREAEELSSSRVLFNGQPLTVSTMTLDARGVLTVIANDPTRTKVRTIPFRVYLRRGDLIVKNTDSYSNQTAEEVEISKLLVAARQGDELVIEPLGANLQKTQKTIILAGYKIYYWFPVPGMMKGDGC